MPRHFTHYYFAKKLTEETSYAISAIVRLYPDAYMLGSLGPDIFQDTEHRKLLENSSVVPVFVTTSRRIFTTGNKCQLAYMLGYMGHYALDRVANQYIHYFNANGVAGYFGGKLETQTPELIELGIDRHIVRDYLGIERAIDFIDNFKIRDEVVSEIANLYVSDINGVIDLSYSKHKMESLIKAIKLDIPLSEGLGRLDFMNREHREWRLNKKKCPMSFDELLTKELPKAYDLLEEYVQMARSNKAIDELKFTLSGQGSPIE